MSTEHQPDPGAVEETKRQIRGLVNEITALTREEVEPTVFYGEFLQRVITALAAVGGAIWTVRKDGGLQLAYQINLREAFPSSEGVDQERHARLLHRVLRGGEHLLVPPYSGAEGDEKAGNPTSFLLVLAPMQDDEKPAGVIEIFQRPTAGPASQRGYLRFLQEMSQHASDYLKGQRLRELGEWQDLFSQVDRFSRTVHENLDPVTTAYTIANEGRRLVGCDRLSVAIRKGNKCTVKAVSGQDTMDTRANSVVLLSKLATAVMRSAEPLWYTGDSTDLPPQIEKAVHNYVDETHTKTVAVLPLFKTSRYIPDGDESKRLREEKEEVIGALIVEQIEDSRPPEDFAQGVELVSQHSARALSNSVEHNNLFLMPLWRFLGNMAWVLQARTLPKTLAAIAGVVLLLAFLFLFQIDFDMEASGELQPSSRRDVFVEIPGKVTDIHIKDRENPVVRTGDPLLTLENDELADEVARLRNELTAANINLASKHNARQVAVEKDEQYRIAGDIKEIETRILSLRDTIGRYERQLSKLRINCPTNLDGENFEATVLNFQIEEYLSDRPLQAGEKVFSLADTNGQWRLEVNMEEDKMGHLAAAMDRAREEAKEGAKEGEELKLEAEYILKLDPGEKRSAVLYPRNIHDAAQMHEELGHSVLMYLEVDETELVDPRVGSEVTVQVKCGKRSVAYVYLHELWEYLQSNVFF